jgi:hypothetical protein
MSRPAVVLVAVLIGAAMCLVANAPGDERPMPELREEALRSEDPIEIRSAMSSILRRLAQREQGAAAETAVLDIAERLVHGLWQLGLHD